MIFEILTDAEHFVYLYICISSPWKNKGNDDRQTNSAKYVTGQFLEYENEDKDMRINQLKIEFG